MDVRVDVLDLPPARTGGPVVLVVGFRVLDRDVMVDLKALELLHAARVLRFQARVHVRSVVGAVV